MGGTISFQAVEQLFALSTLYLSSTADPAGFSTSYAWAPQATESFGVLGTVTLSSTALNSLQPYLILPTGTASDQTSVVTCSPFPATQNTITTSILCPVPVTKIQPGVATISISPVITSTTPSPFTTSFAFKIASLSFTQAQTTQYVTQYVTTTTTLTTRTITSDRVVSTNTQTSTVSFSGPSTTVYTTCTPRTTWTKPRSKTSTPCGTTTTPVCQYCGYSGECGCGARLAATTSLAEPVNDKVVARAVQAENDCPDDDGPPCKKQPYIGCGGKCNGGCSKAASTTVTNVTTGTSTSSFLTHTTSTNSMGQSETSPITRSSTVTYTSSTTYMTPASTTKEISKRQESAGSEEENARMAQITGYLPLQFTFSNDGASPVITVTNTVTKYETKYSTITVSTGTITQTRSVVNSQTTTITVGKRTKTTVSVDCSKTVTKGSGVDLTTTVVPVSKM